MNTFESGLYYAPDGSGGGGVEGGGSGRKEQLCRLLIPIVTKEVRCVAYDPDVQSAVGAWRESEEYRRALQEAEGLWKSRAGELELSENGWEEIAAQSLYVWWVANNAEVTGKAVEVGSVEMAVAEAVVAIEDKLGGGEDAAEVARTMGERMVDQVNSGEVNRKISGEVRLSAVEKRLATARKRRQEEILKAERVRLGEEERRKIEAMDGKLNDLAGKLVGLGERKLRALAEQLAGNIWLDGDKRRSSSELFRGEAQMLLGMSDGEMNEGSGYYWFEAVERAVDLAMDPKARQDFRNRVVEAIKEIESREGKRGLGVQRYIGFLYEEVVEKPRFTGLMPPVEIVPAGLSLRVAIEDISSFAEEYGVETSRRGKRGKRNGGADKVKELLTMEMLMDKESEGAERLRGFMPMGMRDLEMYLMVNETAEIVDKLKKMTPEERLVWAARVYGTIMRGGQGYARFYAQVIGGDESAPSIETSFGKALQWVGKTEQLKGYFPREKFHEIFGHFTPEEVASLMETSLPVKAWVKEGRWRLLTGENGEQLGVSWDEVERAVDFTLSSKDVLGTIYSIKMLRWLKANKGEGVDSHNEAKGIAMKWTILRKMGYDEVKIEGWFEIERLRKLGKEEDLVKANRLEESVGMRMPEIIRTNQISLATTHEINSLDLLAGENWWMIVQAYDFMLWTRGDYMLMPIDEVRRRELLAFRDMIGDYYRYYASVEPPLQLWNENALWPDLLSVDVRAALVAPLQDMVIKQDGLDPEIARLRKLYIERLAVVDQVPAHIAKTLGQMVMGVGVFEPDGDGLEAKVQNWKSKVTSRMRIIERLGVERLKPFELWKDSLLVEGMTEEDLGRLWEGFDFSPLIGRCGVHGDVIESMRRSDRVVGVRGLKSFLQHANASLYDLGKLLYKDSDSINRYPERAHKTRSAVVSLNKIDLEGMVDYESDGMGTFSPSVADMMGGWKRKIKGDRRDMLRDEAEEERVLSQAYNQLMEEYAKVIGEIDISGYMPNSANEVVYEAMLRTWADVNLGWVLKSGRVYVEDIELRDSGGKLKIGAGSHYGIKRITRADFKRGWSRMLGLNEDDGRFFGFLREIDGVLGANGFYFVASAEMRDDQAILIGPNSGFVPAVIPPKDLIGKMLGEVDAELSTMRGLGTLRSRYGIDLEIFKERLMMMYKSGVFCWNTLVDDAANLTVFELVYQLLPMMGGGDRLSRASQKRMTDEFRAMEDVENVSKEIFLGEYKATVGVRNYLLRLWEKSGGHPISPNDIDVKKWR